jgi:5-(carboxyamino)imidazole ribonucleotide synthase
MVNLVGAEGFTGNVVYENMEKILGWTVTPHIYGKKNDSPLSEKWDMSPS